MVRIKQNSWNHLLICCCCCCCMVVFQVLKHEWPARWKTFIPDLVSAAKSSETICENCMAILKANTYILLFLELLEIWHIVKLTAYLKISALEWRSFRFLERWDDTSKDQGAQTVSEQVIIGDLKLSNYIFWSVPVKFGMKSLHLIVCEKVLTLKPTLVKRVQIFSM